MVLPRSIKSWYGFSWVAPSRQFSRFVKLQWHQASEFDQGVNAVEWFQTDLALLLPLRVVHKPKKLRL
jgi:hypothetical protein